MFQKVTTVALIGTALVLVTHDPKRAARAGRTLELSNGSLH